MTRRTRWIPAAIAVALLPSASGCGDAVDALTAHARPAARAGGHELTVEDLATIMAESSLPDSALTANWAAQIGRLWADYVVLVRLYQTPDSSASLDYDALLESAGYYPALAVQFYRDSVVLANLDPSEEELRDWFESTEPFTRLDVRRIRLAVPEGASEAERDSLYAEAERLRIRVAGGADFVEVARRASDEPAAARGQVLSYQGHSDFHPAADSIVFDLRPGEISPVIAAGRELVVYRIERRRSPEFDRVRDMVRGELVERRREERLASATDSLLDNSRRVVADGAEEVARTVAASEDGAEGRIAGSLRLVRYADGAYTVAELRRLFEARPDLRDRFAEGGDEDIAISLYHLAGDEILVRAASESGVGLPEEARATLRRGIAAQLDAVAGRMNITHQLVRNPLFDLEGESHRFLRDVLNRANPVPTIAEFRPVLDPHYPSRVDDRSAAAAAQRAREQRNLDQGEPGEPAEPGESGE